MFPKDCSIQMAPAERTSAFGLEELGVEAVSERANELHEALHECAAFSAALSSSSANRAGVADRASVLSNKVALLAREVRDIGRRYAVAPDTLPEAGSDSALEAQLLTQLPTVLSSKLLPQQQSELDDALSRAYSSGGTFPSASSEAATSAADSALNALPKQRRSRRTRNRGTAPAATLSNDTATDEDSRARMERLLLAVRLGSGLEHVDGAGSNRNG